MAACCRLFGAGLLPLVACAAAQVDNCPEGAGADAEGAGAGDREAWQEATSVLIARGAVVNPVAQGNVTFHGGVSIRGVVARNSLAEGESLLNIPRALQLTSANRSQADLPSEVPPLGQLTPACKFEETPSLKAVVQFTRATVEAVYPWIRKADHDNLALHGGSDYGLPKHLHEKINAPMGPSATEVDVLIRVGHLLGSVRYLEMGVAVGKTFFAAVQGLPAGSTAAGLTFERINPTLAELLPPPQRFASWNLSEYDTRAFLKDYAPNAQMSGFLKQPFDQPEYKGFLPFAVDRYDLATFCGAKRIIYAHGNEFDSTTWRQLHDALAGQKLNLIFADAYKSMEASWFECDNLIDRGMIDFEHEWAYFWDDSLKNHHCTERLREKAGSRFTHGTISIFGWLGQNEHRHDFGIATNMDTAALEEELRAYSISFTKNTCRSGVECRPGRE